MCPHGGNDSVAVVKDELHDPISLSSVFVMRAVTREHQRVAGWILTPRAQSLAPGVSRNETQQRMLTKVAPCSPPAALTLVVDVEVNACTAVLFDIAVDVAGLRAVDEGAVVVVGRAWRCRTVLAQRCIRPTQFMSIQACFHCHSDPPVGTQAVSRLRSSLIVSPKQPALPPAILMATGTFHSGLSPATSAHRHERSFRLRLQSVSTVGPIVLALRYMRL